MGPILSLTLIAEIGNIERFKSSAHLCSYAGIVPSTYSSGGKTTHGNVTKTGARLIRYALGEAIIHTTKSNEFLKKFYEQKSKEKCTSKAKVACMKKLLSYVYIMLKHNISFDKLEINKASVDVDKS